MKRALSRTQSEAQLDAEVRFHFDELVAARVREGMSQQDALRAARLEFGGLEQVKEDCRDARGLPFLDSLLRDIRYALRNMLRSPAFTLIAVLMLAVGIGVNAAVFTVTNAVLFKGFRLVAGNNRMVYISNRGCCMPYPDFEDYRSQAKSFDGMAIVHGVRLVLNDASGSPEHIEATEVSADTFKVVGQRPIIGRDFTPSDEVPGSAPVAILSYAFWERRYGKDPAIIGRAARMNGITTTFIGVMPEGFSFPQVVDVWVPLVTTAEVRNRENRNTWFIFGRLAPGVTFESARAEVEGIARRLAALYPLTNQDLQPSVWHFHEFFIGPDATLIYGSMWGAVGFVLLICCANLANLLLARAMSRSREISIRIALGAGRWRIIRQLLIESLMLSSLGGLLGWWLAKWGVYAYQLAMTQKSPWLIVDYSMDSRVLGYLIAISVGTGLLFGLAPALGLSKLDVNTSLKDGGRGATSGGRGKRLSSLLVIAEIALAVVLLAGAGVMIRSFLKIHSSDMGVNTANLLIGFVELPAARYASAEDRISFHDRLQTRLASIPGIESIATATDLPSWPAVASPFEAAGVALQENRLLQPRLLALVINPGYFHTLGASLLTGREFNDADALSAAPVAIVNQKFAQKFWPGQDAIGKHLRLFDKSPRETAWLTVVGVASNIIQNDPTRQEFQPVVYLPYRQRASPYLWVFARTRVSPVNLETTFRSELQALDPDLPIYGPFVLAERLEGYWDSRFYGLLFMIFAAIALLLASVGLYTVIAHSVRQRTQEIGVRMAIGATTSDVLKIVFKQGALQLGMGLAIGLVASFAVNRLLKSQLVQVSPADPVTLIAASATLILAAALGCLIPARRALRVNPVIALRHE